MTPQPHRVLVLCTGNSCRSQMAEGWINHLLAGAWRAESAGTRPAAGVHPLAVRAMREVGIDLSAARPRSIGEVLDQPWDLVITVCDDARESCPIFPPPVQALHVSFPDPALADGSADERMSAFRSVRDDIRGRLLPLVAARSAESR